MKPILFNTQMILSILEGRKSQTRRAVKPQPEEGITLLGPEMYNPGLEDKDGELYPGSEVFGVYTADGEFGVKCKYQIGDVLWVKELHYRYGRWKKNGISKTGKQKWLFLPNKQFTEVRYFDNPPAKIEKNSFQGTGWYKRNSLFMPREACRLFLEVTGIRVERLQDISEQDVISEGVLSGVEFNQAYYFDYSGKHNYPFKSAIESYRTLWEKINGPGSWDKNPWVWVIEFKQIEKPSQALKTLN